MSHVFLGLGSNVGDRVENITKAISHILLIQGCQIVTVSPLYETKPVGGPPQGDFLNQVIEIMTDLSPHDIVYETNAIEKSLGRIRAERFGPRTIDIDILLFDNRIINEGGLIVPHPCLHERLFVLQPFSDIAADIEHPVLHKTINEIRNSVRQTDGASQTIVKMHENC